MISVIANMKQITITAILLLCMSAIYGQDGYVEVRNLTIIGNDKTQDIIIYRELDIFPGDTISLKKLQLRMLENEKRVLSTLLFTDVSINMRNWDTDTKKADFFLIVQENWYLYPAPVFELADRNFNVWWREQGRSLDRVNYGISLDHLNLTGMRDRLRAKIQFGYEKKYQLRYSFPYLNNRWGYTAGIFYAERKEIGYITEGNKTLFQKADDERKLLSRFRIGGTVNYRPSLFSYHAFRLEYHHNQIDEFVRENLNPSYFLDSRTDLRFFLLEYDFQYDKRVFATYPQGGYLLFFNVKKEGLGIFKNYNNLPIYAGFEKYFRYNKWIYATRFKAKTNLNRSVVSFANNTGLGYGSDVLTGYELYVIDGTDYLLLQTALKYRILDKVLDMEESMPLSQFKKMPISIFLRFNVHTGYVNERTYRVGNPLNNQWALGYGPGIDILIWNSFLIKIEYSFNELGEGAFFLKSSLAF